MSDLVKYAEPEAALPADRQAAWLLMGRGKLVMDKAINLKALDLQIILKDYSLTAVAEVGLLTDKLSLYRKRHTELVAARMEYTQFLDSVKEQCMRVEKEYDPKTNVTYLAACKLEIELREKVGEAAKAEANKATEKASFIAHIKNEWFRIANEYRASLNLISHMAHVACLSQKIPADNVAPAITAAKAAMKSTQPPPMVKYSRTLIPDAEAITIYNSIAKPDWVTIYKDAITALDEKFSMYTNDLASAAAVVQQADIQFNVEAQQSKNDLQAQQAATVLQENAIASATVMPERYKPLTETSRIQIETTNPQWVVKIMAAFMANWQIAFPKLRNSDYSKINIAQMAAALDMAGVKVEGIKYEEIKK